MTDPRHPLDCPCATCRAPYKGPHPHGSCGCGAGMTRFGFCAMGCDDSPFDLTETDAAHMEIIFPGGTHSVETDTETT